jgi:hypothetical protein
MRLSFGERKWGGLRRENAMSTDIARAEKSFFGTNGSDFDKRDDELKHMRERLLRSVILELQLLIEALSRPPTNAGPTVS